MGYVMSNNNRKPSIHHEIHWYCQNSKLSRIQIAAALRVCRQTIYDREYQLVNVRDWMIDEFHTASGVAKDCPAHLRQRDADEAQKALNLRKLAKTTAKGAFTASNPQPPTSKPGAPAPTATAPRPATPLRPINPVMEAARAMGKYEVRFIPSYVSQGSRRSDGWYTLNAHGHMEYFKTKEEATAYADAKRVKDSADIAEFI